MLALSGGPDSTALLLLLSKLQRKYGWKIAAAHLNHGLNPAQAARHEKAAKKLAGRYGLRFYVKRISLRSVAKRSKRSLEEAGRIERYRFFEEVCSRARARKIVTAHTLDDQAETMLLRILRGSGLRGLAGIPRKRRQGKWEVVRPLLSCEKRDLVRLLKEERVPFSVDVTNRSSLFTRNRVRLDLLPRMAKRFNPRIKHTLSSLQAVCEEAHDYLSGESARAFRLCSGGKGARRHGISLKLRFLKRLHPAISREVLCQAILAKRGNLNRLDYDHISSIMDLVQSSEDRLETHLPGPLIVKKSGGFLYLD